MGSKWTVSPETVRIDLEYEGETLWLEMKKALTTGEAYRLQMSGFKSLSQPTEGGENMELNVNYDALVFMKVKTYIAAWSLTDDKGQRMKVDLDTIRALKMPVFKLIEQAIDDHAAAMSALEKKVPSGEVELKTISA